MIRILVSACLLGEKVRYNGASAEVSSAILADWIGEGRIVRFCPEVAGGLGVPRPSAEIVGGDGTSVLAGTASVVTRQATDVSAQFLRGARAALDAAQRERARIAILKDGSPSCGTLFVYDGTFSGTKAAGRGVTTALLEEHGIRVFSENQLPEAAAYLKQIEERDDG